MNNKNERNSVSKAMGTSIPLGAIYTNRKDGTVIGEYTDLPTFAGFCKKAGFTLLQLLPVNDTGTQSSPYSGLSAFALHPIYIDISALPEFDSLYKTDSGFKNAYDKMIKDFPYNGQGRYKYAGILETKTALLNKLYDSTEIAKNAAPNEELEKWIKKNQWIVPYAVYKNLKVKYNQATWKDWSNEDRTPSEKEIKARWNDKKLLIEWRERWAEWCNHKLYFVSDARVDHRSYKEQGIDKLPQIHLGVEVCAVERKGFKTDKGNRNRRIRQCNLEKEIAALEKQMHTMRSEHKQDMIDYLEANIGCKVSDAFVIHDNQAALERYEKFLQSQGVPCEFMFYNEGKCELFIPKAEKDRALALLTSYKKQGGERSKTQNAKPKR